MGSLRSGYRAAVSLWVYEIRRSGVIRRATEGTARSRGLHAGGACDDCGPVSPCHQRARARSAAAAHVDTVRALSSALDLTETTRDALVGSARAAARTAVVDELGS